MYTRLEIPSDIAVTVISVHKPYPKRWAYHSLGNARGEFYVTLCGHKPSPGNVAEVQGMVCPGELGRELDINCA